MIFDDYIASTFSTYQYFSDKKDQMTLIKKSRLKKIEKLAKTLQSELNKGIIFNDEKLQQEIYSTLNHLIAIEELPAFMPHRRHAKIAREMMIKSLAMSFYGLHYYRMNHYKIRLPYSEEENKNKKLTLGTAFIDTITHIVSIVDSSISERRVASIVARIKPQIQSEYPYLFPRYDAKNQKIDILAS